MSSRRAQIAADVAEAVKKFVPHATSRIEHEDDTVVFEVDSGEFTLFLPDDSYPADVTVYGPDDFELEHYGTISEVIERTLQDVCKRQRLGDDNQATSGVSANSAISCKSITVESDFVTDPDVMDDLIHETKMEPLLESHLRSVRNMLGSDAVHDAEMADCFRVRLRVDLIGLAGCDCGRQLIDQTSGKAWGIHPDLPLGVELLLPKFGYLSPSMGVNIVSRVWQEGFEEDFLVGGQLIKILKDFVSIKLGRELEETLESNASDEQLKAVNEYNEKKILLMSEAQEHDEFGFLTHLVLYLQKRLKTVHEYCALCDQPFFMPPMLMRTVCRRTLCAHQYATFGKLITSAEGINSRAEIMELLAFMFSKAAHSHRKELVLDPYPVVYDGNDRILHPDKKDYTKVQSIVDELMELRSKSGPSCGAFWTSMSAEMSIAAAGLMQWVIASNRTYLAPLTSEQRIPEFPTQFQYLLISAPPEKEREFQELKAKHGSFFAFHGSAVGNWHSILRNGLKNASNTPLMSAGAAYGPGIYLGKSSAISAGYSGLGGYGGAPPRSKNPSPPVLQRQITGNRFLENSDNINMLAVCEVVSHSSVKDHGTLFVAPDERTVCTRFFLVFEKLDHDVQLNASVVQNIRSLMSDLGVGIAS